MTLKLFIKDIKLLVRDMKFQIFFLILVALFILSAISSSVTYKSATEDHQNVVNSHNNYIQNESNLRLISLQNADPIQVIDTPSPAVLFSSYENYPNRLSNNVRIYQPDVRKTGLPQPEAFSLNWNFILSVLSGFFMLLLSFEAVSSEKRAGTLRLLSIYGFKRQTILWSKYLSYMLLYLIIIIPPAMISMILFFALTDTWDFTYMMQFVLIILLSIPFASFFAFLGMFISMAKNYRNAIIMVVFIWLFFVIIIPQSANIFGKMMSKIKTSSELHNLMQDTAMAELNQWMVEHGHKVASNTDMANGLRAKAFNAMEEKYNSVAQMAILDYKRQVRSIGNIAQLSPFTQYEKISEIVFDKGSYLFEFQQQTMQNTLTAVKNLMIEQDSRDETSLHLFFRQAAQDNYSTRQKGLTNFSFNKFDHPNLLLVTNTPTDDITGKTLKIILRLLPILILNLLLIISSVVKLEKLDIR